MTIEEYEKHFPDKANNYDRGKFQYISTFEFTFDDVQEFLNGKGYVLQFKEVRHKETYDNPNGRHYTGRDVLKKVIVAVPGGTVLPEVLSYEGDRDIDVTTVFRRLLTKHVLKLN